MAYNIGQVVASMPDSSLFQFPPAHMPEAVAPAAVPASIMRPFNIPESIYTAAMDPRVPLTIAVLYAVAAKSLNAYNASRNKKPWAMSKTRWFFVFVVLHNIFLAVYSAWTFWGMVGVMRRSIVSPFAPGSSLATTVDSMCRIHGPPGLGRSIFFNDTTGVWDSADATALAQGMSASGLNPDASVGGRIWAEGLNYYGWIFYLSKFYEVLDTFIILAKGKYSSTLQTYHHAGAMLCMWAGMRFMSVPIWIFCFANSFIHALMYTYYTLTAFSIRVPVAVKRTLTSLQITQFLVGASLAMVHSFLSYVAPVTTTLAAGAKSTSAAAAVAPSDNTIDNLKKLILGAVGVASDAGAAAAKPAEALAATGLTTSTVYKVQPCIVTSNETFAIWLNVLYLAPLTYLFVSFFIASYVKRSSANAKMLTGKTNRRLSNVAVAEKAGWDAARGIEREVYGGENMVNGNAQAIQEENEGSPKANGRPRRRA